MIVPYQIPPTPIRLLKDEEAPAYDGQPPRQPGGFTMIPESVRALKNGYAVAVYEAIARHANQEGKAWPSITVICEITGWSKPHVIRTINTLVDAGILEKQKQTRGGMNSNTIYTITANVRRSTTDTTRSTTDTQAVNQVYSGGKPQLPEQEPIELHTKEQEETTLPSAGGRSGSPPYSDEFNAFWNQYPRGRGSKSDSFKLWRKLSAADRADALAAIPAFQQGSDWKRGFQPATEVWLRGRRWENPPPAAAENSNGYAAPPSKLFPPSKKSSVNLLDDAWAEMRARGDHRAGPARNEGERT